MKQSKLIHSHSAHSPNDIPSRVTRLRPHFKIPSRDARLRPHLNMNPPAEAQRRLHVLISNVSVRVFGKLVHELRLVHTLDEFLLRGFGLRVFRALGPGGAVLLVLWNTRVPFLHNWGSVMRAFHTMPEIMNQKRVA